MGKRILTLTLSAIFFTQSTAFAAEAIARCSPLRTPVLYKVQAGDHLGDIVRTFGLKPLWGVRRGYVGKVAEQNKISNPNLIFPKDEIQLPFRCEEDLSKYVLVEKGDSREIDPGFLVRVKTYPKREDARRTVLIYPDGHEMAFTDEAELSAANLDQKRLPATATEEASQASAPQKPQVDSAVQQPPVIAKAQEPQADEFAAYSRLFVLGAYDFYRMDSTSSLNQSTALLLSDPSLGVHVGWQQIWSEQFLTQADFKYSQVKMREASPGNLEDGSHSLGEVGLGFGYLFTPRLQANLFLNYGNELYARAINTGTATLDSVYRSQVGISFTPTLIQRKGLGLDLELGYFQILPDSTNNYTIEKGDGYILAPRLRQKLDKMQMELKLKYEKINQNSSISTQKNTQVGVDLGVSFEVGK